MDDLTQCLYEFLLERRMGNLREDAKYEVCSSAVIEQEEQVRSGFSEEQQGQLDRFIDCILEQECMEKEHQFQAVLELVRELSALTEA